MEAIPVIPIDDTPRNRWVDGWSLAWLLIPIAPLAIDASGMLSFRAGFANGDPTAGLGVSFFAIILLLFCGIALLMRLASLIGRRDRKWSGAAITLVLAIPCWGTLLAAKHLPEDSYLRGFKEWAINNVEDIPSIRSWCASLPSVTAPSPVPSATWPKSITSLAPVSVERVPGGVILHWGKLAAWGTSRAVFVGASPGAAAPTPPIDYHHYWIAVEPGVFAGVQGGG